MSDYSGPGSKSWPGMAGSPPPEVVVYSTVECNAGHLVAASFRSPEYVVRCQRLTDHAGSHFAVGAFGSVIEWGP